MNTFCLECTAQDRDTVRECEDKNCPFWRYRWADLLYQTERRNRRDVKYGPGVDGCIRQKF